MSKGMKANDDTHDKWNKQATKERDKAKFLPRNKTIRIYPDKEPLTVSVDGKWGKREMYVLNTSIGLVYFTPVQFIEVTERMRMADFPATGVEYP